MTARNLFRSILIVFLFCSRLYGQQDTSVVINAEFNGAGIERFVSEMEKQSGFHFYYDSAKLDSITITASIKNLTLRKALDLAFINTDAFYTIDDAKHIF
ncbi:MAG TPA: hypothetical protein VKI61_12220, partial [Chitinophagaceae bacterium]|nr:hypothetical protein [Chitinophagaceae bacterium]